MLTPIFIPDKNTHELGNNVNLTGKIQNYHVCFSFLCSKKIREIVGRKQAIRSLSM